MRFRLLPALETVQDCAKGDHSAAESLKTVSNVSCVFASWLNCRIEQLGQGEVVCVQVIAQVDWIL